MASSYTDLGTELMTTGENAGTWGTTTNTNLQIIEEAIRGYVAVGVASADATLSLTDGSTGDSIRNSVIAFTGALAGNRTITVPAVEKWWIMDNQTTEAYTLTVKASGQTGVTWGASDKGTKILYANGTDVIDTGITSAGAFDLDGGTLTLDADADTDITADTDDQIDIKVGGTDRVRITTGAIAPSSADGIALGTSALEFSDLFLADSSVIKFGADQDTTLTHTDGTGLTLNSTNKLCFYDTALYIHSSTDGQLDLVADTEIQIAATTIDINGAVALNGAITGATNITLSGELDAATLDISGNADIDGTTNLDAVDIDGAVQLDATLTIGANDQGYDVILYGDTASANVTWDTSADDLIFNGGAGLIVPDGQLTLGSTAVSSTAAELNLLDTASANSVVNSKAVIYGSSGELAGTLSTAAQTSVTSLGTLTALTVDDVAVNGKVVTMTGSTSDTAVFTAGTNGTLSIVTTDAAAAAANIQITADGTVDIDSAGVLTLDSGAAINIEPAAGSAILLDGTISVDAGVVTGATSITSTAFVGDITGDVTGNTSGTAATVTTAAQTNITSLGTLTALTVDNMVHNGDAITMTPSTSDTVTMTAATNGAFSLVTVDAAAAAANIQITADGTFEVDATTITLDSAGDINLDAAGNNITLKSGGTALLDFVNSSSDVVIKPMVDAKDIIFQQYDGTEVARIEDNATFNVSVAGKFAYAGTAVTSTAAELNKLDGVGTLSQAGKQTVWVPANAMTPTETNGCASITAVETQSGRPDMYVLDFDKDSDEHAQFTIAFPKQWNLGTVTFQAFWSGTANTGGVSWGLQGVACGDNDTIDVAYGTAIVVDDTEQGAVEEVNVSAESGAVTIAGSPADDQLCYFRIFRDVSDTNDNSSGDARLHGIKVLFTTDAANDD